LGLIAGGQVIDLVAETPAQAATWKVWVATQLLRLKGGAGYVARLAHPHGSPIHTPCWLDPPVVG